MVKWKKEVTTMVSKAKVAMLAVATIYIGILTGVIQYSHAVEKSARESGLDHSTSVSIGVLGYVVLLIGIVLVGYGVWKISQGWRAYRSVRQVPHEHE